MKWTLLAAGTALLAACQQLPPAAPAAPALDLSTPERALESYWAQKAWYLRLARDANQAFERKLPDRKAVYGPITTGDAFKYWAGSAPHPQAVLERKIETRQEAGSRAELVARIRNITPIPRDMKPSPRDVERRDTGFRFRYVLERDPAGWKVAEVWRYDGALQSWEKEADPEIWATPFYPSEVYDDIGGSAADAPPPAPPKLDLSSPAQALESYWAQRAWYYALGDQAAKDAKRTLPAYSAVHAPVSTGEVLRYWSEFPDWESDRLERVIQSVEQENPSRALAVVRVRNVMPVPPGAKPSPDDVRRREAGALFRYALEKEGVDWKVVDVWKRDGGSTGWQRNTEPLPHAPFYAWINVSD